MAGLVPDNKVVWHVTDNSVKEWKDTKVSFEISTKNKCLSGKIKSKLKI